MKTDRDLDSPPYQIVGPHDGLHFTLLNLSMSIKAISAGYTLYEAQIPPHFAGLPAHLHRTTTQWFYVTSGTLAFTLNEETSVACAGTLIMVQPHVLHTFWNPGAAPATLLSYRSQPNFVEYLTRLSELVLNESEWPLAKTTMLLDLAAEYDQFPA